LILKGTSFGVVDENFGSKIKYWGRRQRREEEEASFI